MQDKILALVSLSLLFGFVGILLWFVREADLIIIACTVLIMAAIDFFLLNRKSES